MKGHSIGQEEVIMKLTDIYHQLEEVERLLNSNISKKDNWQRHSAARLESISHRLSVLERKDIYYENRSVHETSKGIEYQKKMNLTLGY